MARVCAREAVGYHLNNEKLPKTGDTYHIQRCINLGCHYHQNERGNFPWYKTEYGRAYENQSCIDNNPAT